MAQGKKEINTQIIINASTAAVWSVLIDNENYEKWNPLIVKSEGKIELGKRIKTPRIMEVKQWFLNLK